MLIDRPPLCSSYWGGTECQRPAEGWFFTPDWGLEGTYCLECAIGRAEMVSKVHKINMIFARGVRKNSLPNPYAYVETYD